ncbi:hypothetical protein EV1_004237 [Malus domestica]
MKHLKREKNITRNKYTNKNKPIEKSENTYLQICMASNLWYISMLLPTTMSPYKAAAFKVSWSFLISELNQAKKLQETLNVAALVIPYGCCSIL